MTATRTMTFETDERTNFVEEEDNVSEISYSVSSYSSLELKIENKIEGLKLNSYLYAPDSEVEEFAQSESSLLTMERLLWKALEMNSNLRMQLLLCERQLVLLKMHPLKKESSTETEVPNRDLTRGFLSQFMSPYFKDEKGYGCWTDNIKTPFEFSLFQCFNGCVIQANDYVRVALAIKEYLVEEISANHNLEALKEKVASAVDRERLGLAMKELRSAETEIEASRKKTIWNLLGADVDRKLDWMKIATYEPVHGLSASECQGVWNVVLKPQNKFKEWTKQRQQLLKHLAVRYSFQCWEDIAFEIGGGVTGFLAFVRFLETCGHLLTTNGTWSKDEDCHLLNVIKASTIGKEILWKKVMYYVEDRSISQCITRWYKINPAIKRGRFTKNEDALLLHSIDKFGRDFVKIASVFGNRSELQLRERFAALTTYIDENKITGEWSVEEDRILLKLVKKYGESKWSQISKEMPSRNRVQIRQRYSSVLKKKLMENPELDLQSLQRTKRYSGAHINKESVESLLTDENMVSFIKDKVAGGKVSVRNPVRPGRKSRCLSR